MNGDELGPDGPDDGGEPETNDAAAYPRRWRDWSVVERGEAAR